MILKLLHVIADCCDIENVNFLLTTMRLFYLILKIGKAASYPWITFRKPHLAPHLSGFFSASASRVDTRENLYMHSVIVTVSRHNELFHGSIIILFAGTKKEKISYSWRLATLTEFPNCRTMDLNK